MKSKKSAVRKAVRLAPIFASLSALAMVAACARTNGNKTAISPEKREAAATKTAAHTFKAYNQNDEANLEFASHFKGASIIIHGRDSKNVQATIRMMFDDHEPVVVTKLLPTGQKENAIVDMENVNKADANDITVKANCGGVDCAVVSAQITLVKEIEDTEAPAGASGSANIAAALKPSEPTSSQVASSQASIPTPASPEGSAPAAMAGAPATEEAAAPEAAPVEAPAAAKPKKTVIAQNVIGFSIVAGAIDPKSETLVQKDERLSKMTLSVSGRTKTGEGSKASFEDAYQAVKGVPAPAAPELAVLTEAPAKDPKATDAPAQPAPPEQARDAGSPEASDEEEAQTQVPASAAAPAAAPTSAVPAVVAPSAAPAAVPAAVPTKVTTPVVEAAKPAATAVAPASTAAANPAAAAK